MFLKLYAKLNRVLNYRNVMVFYNLSMGLAIHYSSTTSASTQLFEQWFFDVGILSILFVFSGLMSLFKRLELISIIPSVMYMVSLIGLGFEYNVWMPAVLMVAVYLLSYKALLDGE